ncbi:MAG TPA: N-acetyltransferase [Elusimicrobia bacterium]|nr:MAG: hypothetical protein A2016_03525 [Elusimicrobia bacterium GWF2_62_30]HBA60134.1 N-acetyltransferase [Elusimicrobiota bacterium]
MKLTRLVSPGEINAAARLMAAADPWRQLGLDAASCRKMMRTPFRETWKASEGGNLAGLVTITMYGTFKGYIQALFVAEAFRGRGIGEKLLAFAEKKILRSSPNIFLCVSSFNKRAIKFYRRLGYRKAGVLTDFLVKGHDELLMRKTTGPVLKRTK